MHRALKISCCVALAAPALGFCPSMRVQTMQRSTFALQMSDAPAEGEPAAEEPAAVADPLAGLPNGLDIDGLFGEDMDLLNPLEDEPEELFSQEEIEALPAIDDGKGMPDLREPGWYRNKVAMEETQTKWKTHEADTGSPAFQIARLSAKITYMTDHARRHPKDKHSIRGLITMVNKRRKLLNYLSKKDPETVDKIVAELGIRFKAADRVRSREEVYAAFKSRK